MFWKCVCCVRTLVFVTKTLKHKVIMLNNAKTAELVQAEHNAHESRSTQLIRYVPLSPDSGEYLKPPVYLVTPGHPILLPCLVYAD